ASRCDGHWRWPQVYEDLPARVVFAYPLVGVPLRQGERQSGFLRVGVLDLQPVNEPAWAGSKAPGKGAIDVDDGTAEHGESLRSGVGRVAVDQALGVEHLEVLGQGAGAVELAPPAEIGEESQEDLRVATLDSHPEGLVDRIHAVAVQQVDR